MIVRENLKPEIILKYTWKELLYFASIALAAYLGHSVFHWEWLAIPYLPLATLSTALAVFLGFKSNEAYDRWWEARKTWGQLVNHSRAWARQVSTFVDTRNLPIDFQEVKKALVYRQIAFAHALRILLRRQENSQEIAKIGSFLSDEDYLRYVCADNKPNHLIHRQGDTLRELRDLGAINDFQHMQLDRTLIKFNDIQGISERIKNTPFLRQYNYYPRLLIFFHGTLLPFSFIEPLGLLAIPVSVFVSFIFYALFRIGRITEDPFENRIQDVPLSALSKTIEINLRETLGEKHLPAKLQPQDGFLF